MTTLARPPVAPAVAAHSRGLTRFFAAAFAVTWGIGALLVLAGPQVEALTGEFSTRHPLYYL
ncbi:MAG: hypothetical protein ACRCYX_08415, partial [Dermatophilaceae bacterium]